MTKWLISANPNKYNHRVAFAKWGYVDWRQYANYAVGDIVYIYASKTDSIIRYKTEVTKCNMDFSEIEVDDSFWFDSSDINPKGMKYSRLKLVKRLDNDMLKLEYLLEHGLKNAPQKAMRLEGELLEYIESQETKLEVLCRKLDSSVSIEEAVRLRAEEFTRYVNAIDHSDRPIDFSNPNSVTKREQYKKRLFDRSKVRLNVDSWDASWIGTGRIYKIIAPVITDPDNNIIWHSSQPEVLKLFIGPSGEYNAKSYLRYL